MTTDAPEKMLTRIRALLAKAEDRAATPAEAEAYTAKAAELMARYGVDRVMLADADSTSDVPGDRVIVITGAYARDKQHLCSQVAIALGCKAILRTGWVAGDKQLSVHLFGYGADLERAEMLYTSLLVQAVNGMAQTQVPCDENIAAFRRSWLQGFTYAISIRLRDAERRAQTEAEERRGERPMPTASGRPVALVLADRTAIVEARAKEAYPKLGKAKTRQLSGSGFPDGHAAGHRADLGGTRVGRGRRTALDG